MHNTLFTCTTDGSGTGREVKSVGTCRRSVGALVALAAVAVMVLTGCADAADTTPPAQTVTAGSITVASGQISLPVTNPNTVAVRVRVTLNPVVAAATYAVNGTAFTNAATTGFTLAASAMQTLTVGNLTNGTTYTVSLTTIGSNGVAHSSAVSRSAVLSAPSAFTVTAVNRGAVVVGNNLRTTATLSWTNPDNTAGVILVTSPATRATVSTVTDTAGAENSITVSGLKPKTLYTFIVVAANAIGSTSAPAVSLTPLLPVVLWEVSNDQDGDFGFAICQTELNGGATATSGVHKTLYDAGYRTAKFFGSTPAYDFNDIATDTDALGAVGTRPLVTAVGNSFTIPAQLSGNPMTLGDFTKSGNYVTTPKNNITNSTITAMLSTLVTRSSDLLFTFTTAGVYDTTNNCSGAASNNITIKGQEGFARNTVFHLDRFPRPCDEARTILCIAK